MTCTNPLCNDGWIDGLVADDTVVEERCPACRVPASPTHSGDAPPAPAAPAVASTAPAARAEGGAPGHLDMWLDQIARVAAARATTTLEDLVD